MMKAKESALKPAFDRVRKLGDKITINQKGSEIDEVNEQAGIKPVKVSDDVYTLVKRAYEYSQDSPRRIRYGGLVQSHNYGESVLMTPENNFQERNRSGIEISGLS